MRDAGPVRRSDGTPQCPPVAGIGRVAVQVIGWEHGDRHPRAPAPPACLAYPGIPIPNPGTPTRCAGSHRRSQTDRSCGLCPRPGRIGSDPDQGLPPGCPGCDPRRRPGCRTRYSPARWGHPVHWRHPCCPLRPSATCRALRGTSHSIRPVGRPYLGLAGAENQTGCAVPCRPLYRWRTAPLRLEAGPVAVDRSPVRTAVGRPWSGGGRPAARAGNSHNRPDAQTVRDDAPRSAGGIVWRNPGGVLLSQGATPQVPSALAGLTAVFGMGTGVSPPPWPPETVRSPGLEDHLPEGSTSEPDVTEIGHP
jgi:hypothetical protein